MKRVLITGADGFIGRHLVARLLREGIEVHAVVHPEHNIYVNNTDNNLKVYSLDLLDLQENMDLFPDNIDVMYHFAWNGVAPEFRNDFDVQYRNIDIAIGCVKLCEVKHIKKIIFPGSTNEYLYYGKPINEHVVPSPSNTYGATKIAIRYLCSDYAANHGISFVYAIITGIYSEDRKDSNVIYYTINKLLNGEKPSLTSLEQEWDYVHIDDVVEALRLVGEKGKGGVTYAIGHGDNWPMANYIRIIHKMIDENLPLGIGEIPHNGDVLPSSCIDLTRIKEDTGFEPRIAFEDGIQRVINKLKEANNENA